MYIKVATQSFLIRITGSVCNAIPTYDFTLSYFRILRGATSGGQSYIGLYASNNSCHSATGTVALNVSPKYSINTNGITPTPLAISGNTVTWSINNMANGKISVLFVPLIPLSTTADGDTACNNAMITLLNDGNTDNNFVSVCDTVRSSWDPNAKSVFPQSPTHPKEKLFYTIDFENLGNDTAFNVYIQDTLSRYLDPNSFYLVSSTHFVVPFIYETDSSNIIKFELENIHLGNKKDSLHNKGQVCFSLRPKNGLSGGEIIANNAGIYFDKNPVVLTNVVFSQINASTEVKSIIQAKGLEISPNPTSGVLNINASPIWREAVIYNAIGQVLMSRSLNTGSNYLTLYEFPTGLYYIKVNGTEGTFTTRILRK